MTFEDRYSQIAGTDLWKLLVQRSEEAGLGREFISAVGDVCSIGLDLSRSIIRFFPTFTLHDGTHSANVCRWMYRLLGVRAEELTAYEAALLLMAACCHDIGMSVTDAQKQAMQKRTYTGWDDYFRKHLVDEEEFCNTGIISERMLRKFVRIHHHERIGENLRQSDWPELLTRKGIRREELLALCYSHGVDLSRNSLKYVPGKYDMHLCAVLLRLADLLDYDASRASATLFYHMGLDVPENFEETVSAIEYVKNQVGTFDECIENRTIRYNAVYHSLQVERDIQSYLDWVEQELLQCSECMAQTASNWKNLALPYKISTDGVERRGYSAGKFCMTMDQDKVIELLTGKNLYPDPGVFVRELLQNSIDAVLMRVQQDPDFSLDQGRIIIDTWPGECGDTWFRIRDNGTGMNEHIITDYFLKVGRSYYTSAEFRSANRHAPSGDVYTPISRFGIGILSCFMSDPERTELNVSTKRFGTSIANGIRLNVTGLHGYYYLAHEEQHPIYEDAFLQMPSPDDRDRGYRDEPGTTICVRMNQFRMGIAQPLREILDKYVQFPEVRVEYIGPEGRKEYPTQQELMQAVYALNPDGVVNDYSYEISDEQFQKLQDLFSIAEWKKKPAAVLQYYPINWIADSDKMTGLAVSVDKDSPVICEELQLRDWKGQEKKVSPRIECYPEMSGLDIISINFRLNDIDASQYPEWEDRIRIMKQGISFDFPITGPRSILSENEQRVVDYLRSSLLCSGSRDNLVAYSGVLAAEFDPLTEEGSNWHSERAVLLLRGDFLPEVNLARDEIVCLPREAACCWVSACCHLNADFPDFLDKSIGLSTQRDLWKVMDNHPQWNDWLLAEEYVMEKCNGSIKYSRDLLQLLRRMAWERTNSVAFAFVNAPRLYQELKIIDALSDEPTIDFPAGMFAWPENDNSPLASMGWHRNLYNRLHPFSQWLIQNREQMEVKVPVMYDTLLRAMIFGWDEEKICDTINTILERLKSFENNCFSIQDSLFLSKSDFIN